MYRLLVHCVDRVVAITIRPLLAACQRRGGLVAVLATGLLEAVDRERHHGGSARGQQLAVSTVLFFCVERKIFNFYRIPTCFRWVALMRRDRMRMIRSGHLLPPTGWICCGSWKPRPLWPWRAWIMPAASTRPCPVGRFGRPRGTRRPNCGPSGPLLGRRPNPSSKG